MPLLGRRAQRGRGAPDYLGLAEIGQFLVVVHAFEDLSEQEASLQAFTERVQLPQAQRICPIQRNIDDIRMEIEVIPES